MAFRSRASSSAVLSPVTLVEYADLRCPFCAQFALEVLPTIVRRYVRTGRVKIEYRGISFIGDDSRTALDWSSGPPSSTVSGR